MGPLPYHRLSHRGDGVGSSPVWKADADTRS